MMRVFEKRVLRILFGPKREDVTGEWGKLHNEELYDLYTSHNIYIYIYIYIFLCLVLCKNVLCEVDPFSHIFIQIICTLCLLFSSILLNILYIPHPFS
jgi:hypothetical protein